ncbi:DUF3084 domain-containing protein [Deinococcus maricopensis]|uniref:DUF3084 domain-containing protein n=1 Tax=Deinococcus maricopensis (strain DSM 21211 / LMG 22137 / NRRL B-23946 / LB-34) TaxID=709986 RepID=E8U7U0_DEIML|nr:DUF3084 domain-containing protein [Deinococcus maricopensis]ADV67129.1 hypothetical protein Deima_1480 [Deinococcus maricopensis DSM 21211]
MLWLFVAFVVLLSGFVAYAADNIARRAGRKHLRLFGLRPKTTALIVAVASGMGISLASVLAFALINRQAIANITQADRLRVELNTLKAGVRDIRTQAQTARQERDKALRDAETQRAARQLAITQRDRAAQQLASAQQERARVEQQVSGLADKINRLNALRAELATKAATGQRALQLTLAQAKTLDARLQALSAQLSELEASRRDLNDRVRQADARAQAAETDAQAASARAQAAQARAAQAERRVADAQTRVTDAQARANALETQRRTLETQLGTLAADKARLSGERDRVVAQRDQAARERATLQQDIKSLRAQQEALNNENNRLRSDLQRTQAANDVLREDFTRATSELAASRNDTILFQKGEIVFRDTVASVRNLPDFLRAASASVTAQGARGTPAAVLSERAQTQLQTKLRGLNASAFVVCRSATNVAVGFQVELSCDARSNNVLYRRGQVIRTVTLNLGGDPVALRVQLLDLVQDAVSDLVSRGLPPESVLDRGLNTAELLDLYGRLSTRTGGTVRVGIAPRDEVRPSTRSVDLYPVILN